ncbi:MAG: NADH-quinone oxidoreductase subunit B family protein, partial [Candidatus Hermodarchaeia archaeon]
MEEETTKPTVALFGLTCCAGCQLEILNQEDRLLDILGAINLVQFRMGSSATHPGPYDICFVEGSVTNEDEITKLKDLREKSKVLIAMGACATTGGVNAIRNGRNIEELKQNVYSDATHVKTLPNILPLKEYVLIDFELQG